jgi:D-cysteine desulfhydrase
MRQCEELNISLDKIIIATGSGGTHAGLLVGAKAIAPQIKIIAISAGDDKATMQHCAKTLAIDTVRELNLDIKITDDDVIVFDEFGGGGYGVFNRDTCNAIKTLARIEGILVDPVYTGKAMNGFIQLMKQGYFKKDESILFLHTGGTPALFPYKREIDQCIK